MPRDRDGTFEPQIVKKRQRRLTGVDEIVLSLYAKGLTTGEISAHFAEIYGASVSKETISRITDKVIEEMTDWANRPLDGVYAAVFIDAIVVKVRDGQVANRPIYAAIGVILAGEKDVLGLWAGTGGEGAKFWMAVLTDLKNRGVTDVFFLVCDGLKGLPEVVSERVAADHGADLHHPPDPQHVPARLPAGLGPVETGPEADLHRAQRGGGPGGVRGAHREDGAALPGDLRLWRTAWTEFIPFLDYGGCRGITGWTTGHDGGRGIRACREGPAWGLRGPAVGSGDPSEVDLS